jgi:hypothetical protein
VRRKIFLTLDPPVATALLDLAQREDRDPRRQAVRLVEQGLRRRGMLPATDQRAAATASAAREHTPA